MTRQIKPTPAEVDDLCLAFDSAKVAVELAAQNLSAVKGPLLAAVQGFGWRSHPTPRRPSGLRASLYVADATVASSVAINEGAVGEFESEMSRLGMPKIFPELFVRSVKHSLKKDAAGTLKLEIGCFKEET